MTLDQEKGAAGLAYWDRQHQTVLSMGCVLLVEGEDDRLTVEAALSQLSSTWQVSAAVLTMYGRDRVLDTLRKKTLPGDRALPMKVLGLVDRDTWDDAEVADQKKRLPGLYVTDGCCLENSLLLDRGAERPELAAYRQAWVRAGALGWAQQRAWERLSAGNLTPQWVPNLTLDFNSAADLAATLRTAFPDLNGAAVGVRPDALATVALARLASIEVMPSADQWLRGVHGKEAFKRLYVRYLNQGLAGANAKDANGWRRALAAELAVLPTVKAIAADL